MIGFAVEKLIQADGFEPAVQSRGEPESNQQQTGELTKTIHVGRTKGGRGAESSGGWERANPSNL